MNRTQANRIRANEVEIKKKKKDNEDGIERNKKDRGKSIQIKGDRKNKG